MKRTIAGVLIVIAVMSIPLIFVLGRDGPSSIRSPRRTEGEKIAVGHLTGLITTGSTGTDPGVGHLMNFLESAREAPDIKAVVLRIDSGGGSAAASQEVHRLVTRLRDEGKPVVASMGEVAASGGYYVAAGANRIMANPSTITGSIGVISQYINFSEFAEKHGFRFETITTGPYKDLGNPMRPMTDAEQHILQQLVDDSLDQFVEAIVEGRGLPEEHVRSVADGRIMTGRQAYELGLIDDFGGLNDAIRLAAGLAGIQGEPTIVRQTKPSFSLFDLLFQSVSWRESVIERFIGNVLIDQLRGGEKRIGIYY